MERQEARPTLCGNGRNYGVDILKFVSMFMVVILHVLGEGGGGVLAAAKAGTSQYIIAWLMEIAAYGAVNCFAMTSGYLMVERSYKTARLFPMWAQVLFYSLSMSAVRYALYPEEMVQEQWIKALFPASAGLLWYFSAYVGLFFLMPFINRLVKSLTKRQAALSLVALIGLFTVWRMFPYSSVFGTLDGYSCVWLGMMYYLGACIKYHRLFETVNGLSAAGLYVGGVGVTFIGFYLLRNVISLPFKIIWLTYASPTVVLSCIGLMLLCKRLVVQNRMWQKIIVTLSSLGFGVYIIHSHPLFWNHVLKGRFYSFGVELDGLALAGAVLLAAALIFAMCAVVDWLREQLFKLCRINTLCAKLGDAIDNRLKPTV